MFDAIYFLAQTTQQVLPTNVETTNMLSLASMSILAVATAETVKKIFEKRPILSKLPTGVYSLVMTVVAGLVLRYALANGDGYPFLVAGNVRILMGKIVIAWLSAMGFTEAIQRIKGVRPVETPGNSSEYLMTGTGDGK